MAGFDNDVMYAKNADFTQADNQNVSESNGLFTNGQIWIGATSVNIGGTHVNVGTITSPLGTLSIGYSSPNITLDVIGGSVAIDSITVNSNNAPGTNPVLPNASGNINIQGIGETTTVSNALNSFGIYEPRTAKYIVDPTQYYGTHQTIQAAITAASSGETIFIRPGTYTENLTLKAGVMLTAFDSDGSLNGTGNVIISGTCTMTTAGSVTISGIQLQTNSAALLAVTGSAASIVNLFNCYLNCTNATGITYSSSSASSVINISCCRGDLGTTGIGIFSHSSAGRLRMRFSNFTNTGSSLTASTCSAGTLDIFYCVFASTTTTSGTATLVSEYNHYSPAAFNITAFTAGGSGTHGSSFDVFSSGSAVALSIGASCTMIITLSNVSSTNANAIDGAGAIVYSGINFPGSSQKISTTTQTGGIIKGGQTQAPSAGFVGESIQSVVASGSPVSLSTGAATSVTSISLTAGVWDVSALGTLAGTLTGTLFAVGISPTNNALIAADSGNSYLVTPTMSTAAANSSLSVPRYRVVLTATTTYYLILRADYTVGTATGWGRLSATRVG